MRKNRSKAIWTFIKPHKNTRNPARTLPDTPTYCTLSQVETSILTGFWAKQVFYRQKEVCFCTLLHNFGKARQKFACFCILSHNFAQLCVKSPETAPKRQKMKSWRRRCGLKKCHKESMRLRKAVQKRRRTCQKRCRKQVDLFSTVKKTPNPLTVPGTNGSQIDRFL